MKHYEKQYLDHALKNLDENISWDSKRQQQVRTSILEKIDQENANKKTTNKHWLGKTVIPMLALVLIVGISSTIVLSQISERNSLSPEDMSITTGDVSEKTFPYNISKEHQSKIEQIKKSGFDLRIPHYVPINTINIGSIVKHPAGKGHSVSIKYFNNRKEAFSVIQESIKGADKNRINQIKTAADDAIDIGNRKVYFIQKQSNLKSILFHTGKYGFTISSYTLKKEKLIKIAGSIDISNM